MNQSQKLAVGQTWFSIDQLDAEHFSQNSVAADSDNEKGLFTRARTLAASRFDDAQITVSHRVDAEDGSEYFLVSILTRLPGFAARAKLRAIDELWCSKYEPGDDPVFRFTLRYH